MTGEERRDEIVQQLNVGGQPISASTFAKKFGVSRQVIVGDIALIRAGGGAIRATGKGYVTEELLEADKYVGKIAADHLPSRTEEELFTIVRLGGVVVDVVVEHPIYGEITGNLDIKTEEDVTRFLDQIKKSGARLLSDLTNGLHLHTVMCQSEEAFLLIKKALEEKELLYHE